jgi:hypothetical protein
VKRKGFHKPVSFKKLYNNWKILYYKEKFTPWERHGDSPLHRHHAALLIASNK